MKEKISEFDVALRIHCPDDATWRAARSKDVTASVAGALLHAHEFETPRSLFEAKTAGRPDEDESEPMRRGRLLEPVAVQILRERHPEWAILHNAGKDRRYYRDPFNRIGATPDVEVATPDRGHGIIQIKSVEASVFNHKWKQDGEIVPPTWIAIQAMVEMWLTGASWAMVTPLVVGHGVELPEIEIPYHDGVMTRLRAEGADFWRRVAANDPPPFDFAKDAALIAQLYAEDNGETKDLSADPRIMVLIDAREKLKELESAGAGAAKERKPIDAEIINLLGNASAATLPDGRIVTAKTVRKKGFAVEPTTFRSVKVREV